MSAFSLQLGPDNETLSFSPFLNVPLLIIKKNYYLKNFKNNFPHSGKASFSRENALHKIYYYL